MPSNLETKSSLNAIARFRINELLRSSGLTQTEFADHLGKTQSWVSKYLNGEIDIDLDTLREIARLFKVRVADLLEEDAPPPHDAMEALLLKVYRRSPGDTRAMLIKLLDSFQKTQRRRPSE